MSFWYYGQNSGRDIQVKLQNNQNLNSSGDPSKWKLAWSDEFNSGNGSIVLDIGPYMTVALTQNSGIGSLVDQLNTLLCGGELSNAARSQIVSYVANAANFGYSTPPTYTQMRDRVRAVVHLILDSPEYTIQR